MIIARAGARVLVDGSYVGLTSDELGGLLVQGVAARASRVEAFRPGYAPAQTMVRIQEGELTYLQLVEHIPKPLVQEVGQLVLEREVGDLIVLAQPASPEVTIRIQSAGKMVEGTAPAVFRSLAAARTRIFVNIGGTELQHDFDVRVGEQVELIVDQQRRRVFERTVVPSNETKSSEGAPAPSQPPSPPQPSQTPRRKPL
jgi:hypothetical protein